MTDFSSFFHLLAQHNIDGHQHPLVPQQFYATSYDILFAQLKEYQKKQNILHWIVVTDGLPKLSAPHDSTDVTARVLGTLKGCTHLDLAALCNVPAGDVHASQFYLDALSEALTTHATGPGCGYLALGSGSITDLLKHALFLRQCPTAHFVSVPTATTVTAFSAAFAVIETGGIKKTQPSQPVGATFWVEPLLQAAPAHMTRAGIGDLLAFFVAQADWYLADALGMGPAYNTLAYDLMKPLLENVLTWGHDKGALVEALAMAGVAMSLTGHTTPLSGYEHAISHSLDFLNLNTQQPLRLHGEQVALGCLTSAASYQWFCEQPEGLATPLPALTQRDQERLISKLIGKGMVFGPDNNPFDKGQAVASLLQDYQKKYSVWQEHLQAGTAAALPWQDIRTHLKTLTLSPATLSVMMTAHNLALCPEDTTPPTTAAAYRWAVRFTPFVRSRFCLADLLFWIGEDPCFIAAL